MKNLIIVAFILGIAYLGRNAFNNARYAIKEITGTGTTTDDFRNVSAFTGVASYIAGDVEWKLGEKYGAQISAPSDILSYLTTEVNGDILEIKTSENIKYNSKVKIVVTSPELRLIAMYGSGNFSALSDVNRNSLKIELAGSGEIEVHHMEVEDLKAKLSGSGNINLGGNAKQVDLSLTGSGNLDAEKLKAANANIDISGSGNASCGVEKSLNADISGSGNIRYSGNPQVNVSKSGSGTVEKE
jgi:Putative auto-transporter adhesin, head GIN domain